MQFVNIHESWNFAYRKFPHFLFGDKTFDGAVTEKKRSNSN